MKPLVGSIKLLIGLPLLCTFDTSALAANTPLAADAGTYHVEIRNFAFAPKTLTVPAGTRVEWTNRDDEPHVVTSAGASFASSKALDTGDSYTATFAKRGTYTYYCSIHPMMVGTIIVQ
ncbi:cupredoxin domain-containing protein [Dyella acidiphila]|uniref:Cupredoxin family copper-binding protein n=1 Tax=Dyella acidiphila TaxID=2775866 RepID=A0ABR9G7M2_9GAMM|nr:cupredoxin family copper-binding protein [Dyella acidiphila]MBE1160035.1 cupredoxin family copper-binding protein [Dyella acidiphila]